MPREHSSRPLPTAISFCFGSKRGQWERFSTFFLMDNGSIFVICPVIPHNWCVLRISLTTFSIIPASYLTDLSSTASATLENLYGTRKHTTHTHSLIEYYEYQLEWLTEVKGPVVARGKEATETSPQLEDSWIRTKPPSYHNVLFLQGPIDSDTQRVEDSLEEKGSFPCGLYSLPSIPMVLLKLFHTGLLQIFLCFEEIVPKWQKIEVCSCDTLCDHCISSSVTSLRSCCMNKFHCPCLLVL